MISTSRPRLGRQPIEAHRGSSGRASAARRARRPALRGAERFARAARRGRAPRPGTGCRPTRARPPPPPPATGASCGAEAAPARGDAPRRARADRRGARARRRRRARARSVSSRKGFVFASSSRYVITSRSGGAWGGRISSRSSAALSLSPHCTSSMKTTSGCRRAICANRSRSATKARCRSTCGSAMGSSAARAIPGTLRRTGKRRASAQTSRGIDDRHALIDEPLQVAAQRVDHRVDGLVRNRLALVGAPAQDLGLDVLFELVDEVVHERRLAEARRAGDADGDRVPAARRLERVAKDAEVLLRVRRARGAPRTPPRGGSGRPLAWAARRRRISGPVGRSRASRLSSAQQRASSSGGTSPTHSLGAMGSSVRFMASTSTAAPANGGRPTSAS